MTRWSRIPLLVLLVMVVGQVANDAGTALGPVTAVTPDEVAVASDEFVGYVFNPSVSGRGEAVGIHDHEVRRDAFVQLDVAGPEPMARGYGTAVSRDGCVALWTRDSGSTDPNAAVAFGITDRCDGFERVIGFTSSNYDFPIRRLALSADGRFAAVEFASCFACEFDPYRVIRIDTQTLEQRTLPVPDPFYGTNASLGLDISDDGNIVTTVLVPGFTQEVAVWNVATDQVTIVSNPTGATAGLAAFPSVSGDGRFVSFASTRNNPVVRGRGPWVFVVPVAGGPLTRISGAGDGAYYSSLSADATQIAYGVTASSGCSLDMVDLGTLEGQCPTTRVDVAFGPIPGLASGASYETISLDTAGAVAGGMHIEPDLSSNGRWITWVSDNGFDLVGTGDPGRFSESRHAFLRRRDAALSIEPAQLDFPTIAAGAKASTTVTVRNTGRSSVALETISAGPTGQFTVVGGGSCVQGASLPPAATCTVGVQFSAPNATATLTGTVVAGELASSYDPVSATGRLIGRSSLAPPPTTTLPPGVTTTTTTIVGQVPPTTTTTTTVPGQVALDAQPSPVDFGPVAIGIAAPFQSITVTNVGTGTGIVATDLIGANPTDFWVSDNRCDGATLAPLQSCVVTLTMVARGGGDRTAELSLTSGGDGGTVTLMGQGRYAPQLITTPEAVTESGTTRIIGLGFPPGQPVVIRVLPLSLTLPATPDDNGRFVLPLAPRGLLGLGSYTLQVDAAPSVYETVLGQLVVVLPTFEPQGPGGPAFGTSILVTRGG